MLPIAIALVPTHDKTAEQKNIKDESKYQENNWTKYLNGQNRNRKVKLS
jgi:hypothetical protein